MAERYSISGIAPLPSEFGFTLLDPTWLLPPIETLDAAARLTSGSTRAETMLRDEALLVLPAKPPRTGGPLAYPLSDDLTAQLRYRRPQLFGFSRSQVARDDMSSAFSSKSDRDVLDLNMSWRLAGSTVGVGYQLQSTTHGALGGTEAGLSRFMPGSEQATHSLSLGFTREWGRSSQPQLGIETPLVLDDAYLAASLLADHRNASAASQPTPTP